MGDGLSTKKLILHIELPVIYADDWPETLREYMDGDPDNPNDMAALICEEIDSDCAVTLLLIGDEGGPILSSQEGRIVGAQVVDR